MKILSITLWFLHVWLAGPAFALEQLPAGPAAPPVADPDVAGVTRPIPAGKILWIGAHPDDEVLLAPLLGELCATGLHPCALLVATRGENGSCRLAGGCHPDLATVRSAEMRSAARLFDAELLQGSLPDVFGPDPGAVRQAWDLAAGGDEELLQRLADAIDGVAPRVIITFDERHGTTCHNAHRAIGRLVLRALGRLSIPTPEVYLLESRVRIAPGGTQILFSPALLRDPRLLRFAATEPLAHGTGTAWSYLLADAERQPSQFDATFLATLRAVPPRQRDVYLLAADALAADPAPIEDPCPP
jgi:LmbE family N-acetylglucosaminyl deacetylase